MGGGQLRTGWFGEGGASGRGATGGPWQPALPPLRDALGDGHGSGFAHPAEDTFSRLLSYYRVRWVYEPTSFALGWATDGRPLQMFTPDFYLPDERLYIELTTMRQRLVTRKNRKLRLLRELYPNVRIKLLYRRDYLRLLEAYAGPGRPAEPCTIGRVLVPADALAERVAELGARIAADLRLSREADDGPLLALGVGRGSERFLAKLASVIAARGAAIETDRVDLSRYQSLGGARRVRVSRGPTRSLDGRRVLLVEDVVSTGLSSAYLSAWLGRRGVRALERCALLDRRGARLVDLPVRYAGFEAPNGLLAGFGLDLRREFRDLPFVAVVESA